MGARNRRAVLAGAFAVGVALAAAGCFGGGGSPASTPLPESPTATASVAATPSPTATTAPSSPPTARIAAARELHREGRYGEARDAFLAVAAGASSPAERADALIGAAVAAFELDDQVAGFVALREAVGVAPRGSTAAVHAAYLLMKHLNDAAQGAAAVDVFQQSRDAAAASPLEPYFLHEGARAALSNGQDVEADALWARALALPGASEAFEAAVYRAQADEFRKRGDAPRLAKALDGLIAASGEAAARFERAELARAAGDSGTEVAVLQALVARTPNTRLAPLALARLDALGYPADPGQAGFIYYRRGMYAEAKAVLLPAVELAPTAADRAFRAFYLAAAYEDSGNAIEAVRFYDLAAASAAGSPYVHRAMYWAARVTEGEDKPAEASRRYVELVSTGPRGEFTEEAAFRAGFVLYAAGDSAGALAAWEQVAGSASARLQYWRARALSESGDSAGARAAYQRAVELGPYDLHGLESARVLSGQPVRLDAGYRDRDLARDVDWVAIASWLNAKVPGQLTGGEATAACELAAMGLREAAAGEIWAAAEGAGPWETLALMREARGCGLTNVAAQLAVNLRIETGVASHEAPRDLLRVSYPIDYASTVVHEARKAGIDPLFFAALIRQESFWDPAAGSVAGALGLTQVIPPTGEAIAASLGVSEFEASDLFRPAVSLEFGADYLGGQVKRYGDPLLALAAYNAGPGAASRWAAEGAQSPAELVEVVDFVETRTYVTYIYEAYAHYQLAWAE